MFKAHVRAFCEDPDHKPRRIWNHSPSEATRADVNVPSSQIEDIRRTLADFMERFQERFGCSETSGYLDTLEDLPDYKIRAGTTVIESGNPTIAPGAKTCRNCGWRAFGGTTWGILNSSFYCKSEPCQEIGRQLANEKHAEFMASLIREGKCIYDRAWIGYCQRPVVSDHAVCAEHLEQRCVWCQQQATRECSAAGSFVCGNPLCDVHKCPAHGY